jgi:hypothetical protein
MMGYILTAVICGLSLIVGAHLTIIGASLLGVSLMAFGLAVPLLAVTAKNYNEDAFEV